MFVMGNVLIGIATVLDYALSLYMWVIIARALISWVNPDPWNPIVQFLDRATEPVLSPIRRLLGWRSVFCSRNRPRNSRGTSLASKMFCRSDRFCGNVRFILHSLTIM